MVQTLVHSKLTKIEFDLGNRLIEPLTKVHLATDPRDLVGQISGLLRLVAQEGIPE